MYYIKQFIFLILFIIASGCSVDNGTVAKITDTDAATDANTEITTVIIEETYQYTKILVPTLVVIMNWNDFNETDASIWYDKLFNHSTNSVNKWYDETLGGEYELSAVAETSGTTNDGIIMIDMNTTHPGGNNDTTFRDTHITNAISHTEVVDKMDFTLYDANGDGILSKKELQIIFIVAGGEQSYQDPIESSIWAHAWSYGSSSTLEADGMKIMRTNADSSLSGSYARFGANHGTHKATIGIIAHEIGHSLFSLRDYYDDGGGSGLGWYDVMSGGSWTSKTSDTYEGDTPVSFSVYNKIDAGFDLEVTDVDSSTNLSIKCSSREFIKLKTSKTNEYFLIECRDTAKENSDMSLNKADNDFTEDKLFMMTYHIDTDKSNNTQDGTQTSSNHYMVALVEKETTLLMTKNEGIRADYDDVYLVGDTINTSATFLYDGTATNYAIEVVSQDTTNRKMTIQITK